MSRKFPKVLLVFLIALLFAGRARAADFQLWFETDLRYKATKKLDITFEQNLRLADNASRLESVMPELALRYEVFKFLDLQGGYRFIIEPEYSPGNNQYNKWHRIFFGAEASKKLKPFTLKYRFRFQEEFGWPYGSGGEVNFKHTFRNRFAGELDAGRGFEPFISFELFLRAADNDGVLHKLRALFGSGYRLLKSHRISLFYGLEKMLNGSGNPLAMILGIGYRFSF
jgi:hypothetical protein